MYGSYSPGYSDAIGRIELRRRDFADHGVRVGVENDELFAVREIDRRLVLCVAA
jgi:hypothetical protein